MSDKKVSTKEIFEAIQLASYGILSQCIEVSAKDDSAKIFMHKWIRVAQEKAADAVFKLLCKHEGAIPVSQDNKLFMFCERCGTEVKNGNN